MHDLKIFKLRLKPEVTTAVSPGAISTPVSETLHSVQDLLINFRQQTIMTAEELQNDG